MKWALVDSGNIVRNVIAYDGQAPYQPPEGLILREVNDWIDIGLDADLLEDHKPRPSPPDPQQEKAKRNRAAKQNLGIIFGFDMAKRENPELIFSDFLDDLESKRDQVQLP